MKLDDLRDCMKNTLKQTRYLHSLGVEEVACDLAVIYGYDMEKAGIAGILHDCAKNLPDGKLLYYCELYHLPVSRAEALSPYLLHGKVGAVLARENYEVEDQEILDAITYHTTGRPAMGLLEKIIFTADYIEPFRKPLPGMDEVRRLAYSDLDQAVLMILESTLNYLEETKANQVIDQTTADTYAYYKSRRNRDFQ